MVISLLFFCSSNCQTGKPCFFQSGTPFVCWEFLCSQLNIFLQHCNKQTTNFLFPVSSHDESAVFPGINSWTNLRISAVVHQPPSSQHLVRSQPAAYTSRCGVTSPEASAALRRPATTYDGGWGSHQDATCSATRGTTSLSTWMLASYFFSEGMIYLLMTIFLPLLRGLYCRCLHQLSQLATDLGFCQDLTSLDDTMVEPMGK